MEMTISNILRDKSVVGFWVLDCWPLWGVLALYRKGSVGFRTGRG
jgi:hypothetical protein